MLPFGQHIENSKEVNAREHVTPAAGAPVAVLKKVQGFFKM